MKTIQLRGVRFLPAGVQFRHTTRSTCMAADHVLDLCGSGNSTRAGPEPTRLRRFVWRPCPMTRILVIDDDPAICGLLHYQLELLGYHVEDLPEGRQALAALRDRPADLIVTDLFMPGGNGFELLHDPRQRPAPPPVIAMSGGMVSPNG